MRPVPTSCPGYIGRPSVPTGHGSRPPEVNMDAGVDPAEGPVADGRIGLLLEIAGSFGATLPLDELHALMPTDTTTPELRRWIAEHPSVARLEGDVVVPAPRPPGADPGRRERGTRRLAEADARVRAELPALLPWIRCIALTGSSAYGEPEEDDDIDFLVVTRSGAVWAFLAGTYLLLRFGPHRGRDPGRSPLCFNYVLDDREAIVEYGRPGGLLFAREALTVRPLRGDAYYRDLLGTAPWIREELPRMYDALRGEGRTDAPVPAPWLVRGLNVLAFPVVAAYLQLAGLRRNARLRRNGRAADQFVTRTGRRRLAFASARFETLRIRYLAASASAARSSARAPARGPPPSAAMPRPPAQVVPPDTGP
jgi:hypothetical protein